MPEEALLEQLTLIADALNNPSLQDQIIAVISPILAGGAVIISLFTAHKQNAIALFEKRYEVYSKLHNLLKTGKELEQAKAKSKKQCCDLSFFQHFNLLSILLFSTSSQMTNQRIDATAPLPSADAPKKLEPWLSKHLEQKGIWDTLAAACEKLGDSAVLANFCVADSANFSVESYLSSLQLVERTIDQIPLLFPKLPVSSAQALQSAFSDYAHKLVYTYKVYRRSVLHTPTFAALVKSVYGAEDDTPVHPSKDVDDGALLLRTYASYILGTDDPLEPPESVEKRLQKDVKDTLDRLDKCRRDATEILQCTTELDELLTAFIAQCNQFQRCMRKMRKPLSL